MMPLTVACCRSHSLDFNGFRVHPLRLLYMNCIKKVYIHRGLKTSRHPFSDLKHSLVGIGYHKHQPVVVFKSFGIGDPNLKQKHWAFALNILKYETPRLHISEKFWVLKMQQSSDWHIFQYKINLTYHFSGQPMITTPSPPCLHHFRCSRTCDQSLRCMECLRWKVILHSGQDHRSTGSRKFNENWSFSLDPSWFYLMQVLVLNNLAICQ